MSGSPAALLLLVSVCVSLQDGLGHPLTVRSGSGDVIGDVIAPASHEVRSKRCACNNQLDAECHYFCHLDIIWINTPSKTTLYGLGSPLARRRRSAGRCACVAPGDRACARFCTDRSPKSSTKRARTNNLLEVLRRAVVSDWPQGLQQRKAVPLTPGLSGR